MTKTKKKIKSTIIILVIMILTLMRLFTDVLGSPVYLIFISNGIEVYNTSSLDMMVFWGSDYEKNSLFLHNLKYCKKLKDIQILGSQTSIPNLDFLKDTKVSTFAVSGNVDDWSTLEKCDQLEMCIFTRSNFKDFSLLKNCRKFSLLSLETDEKLCYDNIDKLDSLDRLLLQVPELDFSQITKLPNLTYFLLSYNNCSVKEIGALSDAPHLKSFSLSLQNDGEKYLEALKDSETIEDINFHECYFNKSKKEVDKTAEEFTAKGVKVVFEDCSYEE